MNVERRLDRGRVLELLAEAAELVGYYYTENRRNPRGKYDYGTVEEVALRALEKRDEVVFVGATLRGDHINVHARVGYIDSDGSLLYADPTTVTYVLGDLNDRDVARFGMTLCNRIIRRATNGDPRIRGLMSDTAVPHVTIAKGALEPYLH